jgi:uncharacterized protein
MSERRVVDNTGAGRFELRVGDDVAGFAEYQHTGDALAFTHTVVEPQYEGQGIGSALARGALEAAREQGLSVLPHCPFIRGWIQKHPDHVELVPSERWAEFRLTSGEAAPGRS